MLITMSSPALPEEVLFFFMSNASPFYFSICKSKKIQLQICCIFGDTTQKVKFTGIPENNFVCVFITASSPLESKQEASSG